MSFSTKKPAPSAPKIIAWSFSRWGTYEECPKKAKFKFIDRLSEPSSPVLERGTEMHKLCEDYLRGIKKTVPKDLKKIEAILKDLKKRGAIPEAEFAFDEEWNVVDWFAKNAKCRVKADVTIPPIVDAEVPTVEIHDFKTGGEKKLASGDFEDYYTQLELYAVAGLLTYPAAERVKTSLIFIDHGQVVEHPTIFERKDLDKILKRWAMRTKKMLADTKFPAKPANGCRWCHFRKGNGGPCEY